MHLGTQIAAQQPTDTMEHRIAYARIRAGLSQAAMAQLIGVHRDYYKIIEKKSCERIDIDHLFAISKTASVSLSWLIYGDDPPPLVSIAGATIGQRLRNFRVSNALSGCDIARRAFGVNKLSSLYLWEKDQMVPELRSLRKIADAFGFNVVSLLQPG